MAWYPAVGGDQLLTHPNVDESQNITLEEKKEFVLYDAIYVQFWELQINLHWQKAGWWLAG